MKATPEIAKLIQKHDELETKANQAERLVDEAVTMKPFIREALLRSATGYREEIRVIQLQLAAQGFWMFPLGKVGVGE